MKKWNLLSQGTITFARKELIWRGYYALSGHLVARHKNEWWLVWHDRCSWSWESVSTKLTESIVNRAVIAFDKKWLMDACLRSTGVSAMAISLFFCDLLHNQRLTCSAIRALESQHVSQCCKMNWILQNTGFQWLRKASCHMDWVHGPQIANCMEMFIHRHALFFLPRNVIDECSYASEELFSWWSTKFNTFELRFLPAINWKLFAEQQHYVLWWIFQSWRISHKSMPGRDPLCHCILYSALEGQALKGLFVPMQIFLPI